MIYKKAIKLYALILLCVLLLPSCEESVNSSESEENSIQLFSSEASETEASIYESEEISFSASEDVSAEPSEAPSEESEESVEESSEFSSEDAELSYDPSYSEITIDSAGERYADKFTDGEIISDESSYKSKFINVTYKEINFEGKLYFVQDIYIKDIECLSVGFAGLKFGKKYNDYVYDMVSDYRESGVNVIGAVNGDYCGLNGKGAIIRNGKLYGTGIPDYSVCVLYKNGVMAVIEKNLFNAEKELERGAWHVWDFGPSFLNSDGSPVEKFTEKISISRGNPRTAIGYFEPGHYCFVVAGGRATENAYGVSFVQISRFLSNLGCKVGYNLDGGKSSVMVFGDKISNEKYQGTGRRISDIVFVKDVSEEPSVQ